MNMNMAKMVGALVMVGLLSGQFQAAAQQGAGASADKLDSWKRAREEFLSAERELVKNRFDEGGLEKEIEKLNGRKAALDKQIPYFRAKVDAFRQKAALAANTGNSEEAEKANKDVAYWDAQLKAGEAESASVEAQLKTDIEKLKQQLINPKEPGIILPGDALQLYVLEDESFNGLYQVRRGGYIILPRVGRVTVAGKDLVGAEKSIKESLEATQLRQGTVMLERSRDIYTTDSSSVIYLAGEFNTTGPLRVPEGVSPTIITTILRSGGTTKSADLTRVKLLRLEGGKGLVEEVDVKAMLDGSGLQSDLALNPGDIIVVPSFAPIIYVTGNVKAPGQLTLKTDEELSAYAAILRSGGFARFANLKKVYVLRDHGNGEKSKIPLNIKELQAGKGQDVILQGKDVVVVPESFFSW